MDMQATNEIMKKAPPDQYSFEYYYLRFNAEVIPVNPDSKGFKLIEKYARNTAPNRKIEVVEVFKISRKGEKDRFAKYNHLYIQQNFFVARL